MKVKIQNLSVEFKNGTRAIDNVSLEIENGIFGLLGENGAGKTTLMRTMTTVLPATSGNIIYGDTPLSPQNYYEIQKKIGYLPQELNLYPHLRVRDALEYIGRISGLSAKECKSEIDYYLESTHLTEHQKKRIGQLSGGMKRRVGLIQAMMTNPEVLIVDEPTTGLDSEERIRIRNLLSDFAKDSIVLFSTHVIEDISATCRKLAVMKKGKLLYQGDVTELKKMAMGHIGTIHPNDEKKLESIREKYYVIEQRYESEEVEVKVMSSDFVPEEIAEDNISLEDAYIYISDRAR